MRITLQNRIQFTVISIVAVLSLFLCFFFPARQRQQIQDSFADATQALAVTVALGVQIGLESGDFSTVQRVIDFAQTDTELLFAAVISDEGEILAAYPESFVWDESTLSSEDVILGRSAVETEVINGEVVIGRSTRGIQDSLWNVRLTAIFVSLIVLLFGSLGALWLARSVSRPILSICNAAERVGAGDLNLRVEIASNDELGTLAKAFNKMVEDIRRYLEGAQAATRAKSEFLASMSHEIRTPMNGVIGMTNVLLDTDLTENQREYVEVIRTSGESLMTIINEILDFSKIEAGRLDLEMAPFEVATCVEDALDLLVPKTVDKGLELIYYVEANVPVALIGDATRVRQVLVNLLSNAIKFTHEGEVVVLVDAESIAPGRYRLHLSVRDTGIGIPPEKIEGLFEAFTQADASTTRQYGGTGLGLTICKKLCTMMGGDIWAESEVGKGSVFHFTFEGQDASDHYAIASPSSPASLAGKHVLIVDDNATNRRVLSLPLQAWGMTTKATASPLEALQWRRQGASFDMILLDMQMPEMDGLTLAREIAALDTAPPMIMLTSMGVLIDTNTSPLAACLHKPVKKQHLLNVLIRTLDGGNLKQTRQAHGVLGFDTSMGTRLPLRILLAEDNPVNQQVALRLLERLGYRADVASNGLEVLEMVARMSYDVVLMDFQMPEMDGLEATRVLRAREGATRRLYIVAMTANAMKEDHEQALEAGMDHFLSKPVRPKDLAAALEQAAAWNAKKDGTIQPTQASEQPIPAKAFLKTMLETLRDIAGDDDPAFARAVLTSYQNSATNLLADLEAALREGDVPSLTRAAHTLKSSSAMIGCAAFSARCADLEKACKADGAEAATLADLAQAVQQAFPVVEAAVATLHRQLARIENTPQPPKRHGFGLSV